MNETRIPVAEPVSNGELRSRVQQIRLDNQLTQAKTGRSGTTWLPWVLCALLAFTWALLGIRGYRLAGIASDDTVATAPANSNGSTNSASSASLSNSAAPPPAGTVELEVKGYLIPARQLSVSPIDVGGRLVELNVVEGQFYEQGAVLARIDPASYEAFRNEAQASVNGAQQRLLASTARLQALLPSSVRDVEVDQVEAQLEESKAQLARALDDEKRLTDLGGVVSARETVQARIEVLAAKARIAKLEADLTILKVGPRKEQIQAAEADVAAAKADLAAADARLVQAQWRLDNCVIKAPIAGTVLTKKAEIGNLVNPQAFAGGSGSVCDMADLADLEVDLKIAERDISKIVVGQTCRIRPDAYPNMVYTGRLDRIMPIANRADSTVNVRVKVKLPEGEAPGTYLKPEMGAVVSFLASK